MENHHQFDDAAGSARDTGLNRVAPYVAGAILPLPILALVRVVICITHHDRLGDFWFPGAWIVAMAVGLVSSVRCCRLAGNNSTIALLGGMFVLIYLFGILCLGIYNR